MSRLDELPPDQRAALSLLVTQKKRYAELAALLQISEQAVHDRAHGALAMLAPAQARAVPQERREEIADYVLGQQPSLADRLRTRSHLATNPQARAWAQALALELAPLGSNALADIPPPSEPATPPRAAAPAPAQPQVTAPPSPPPAAPPKAPQSAPVPPYSQPPDAPLAPPGSRRGGALLLAVIVAAVVVAVVLITKGGSGSHNKAGTTSSSSSSTSTSTTKAGAKSGPTISARLSLRSPDPTSRSVGLVTILTEGSKRAFYAVAENLAPSRGFFYALWLNNPEGTHEALGKAPEVGSTHRLEGGGLLPNDAANFKEILLTRETSTTPTHPGRVILRGAFSLSG